MSGFVVVVNERNQIHVGERPKLVQEVIRADAVATIGRVRQTMREEQDSHAGSVLIGS